MRPYGRLSRLRSIHLLSVIIRTSVAYLHYWRRAHETKGSVSATDASAAKTARGGRIRLRHAQRTPWRTRDAVSVTRSQAAIHGCISSTDESRDSTGDSPTLRTNCGGGWQRVFLEQGGSRLSRGRCRRGACLVSLAFSHPGAAAALTSLPFFASSRTLFSTPSPYFH
jgi:hypothetical protein